MLAEVVHAGYGTLAALLVVMAISVWLGSQAQKVVEKGSFLKGYFLGNRGLGAWALALTATVQSGGTFMGFPSLVYSFGWIVALWIAGYTVVPITGFAIFGKRFAQLSRRTGAITVPDLFRERFGNPTLGLVTSLLIMFFITVTMVAQFKAGAIVMKLAWPGTGSLALAEDVPSDQIDTALLIGLLVFSLTVVGYTLIGGFLASVWTDLFQSVLMAIGVVTLFCLVAPLGGTEAMKQPTLEAVRQLPTGPHAPAAADYVFGPGYRAGGRDFLPVGLAFSYFFVWVFGGLGTPAGMVRVMACKDTPTMRRSIVLLSFYNLLIYLPLIVICICARSIFPNLTHSDEVIPRVAIWATRNWTGGSIVTGLILSAPFGAVMASVSSFLVVIASGLVRDVYQRFLRPEAEQAEIRRVSYAAMILLGIIGFAANIKPVEYLQSLIVFSGTALAASFVVPGMMTAYWRRATAAGALAAMLVGSGVTLCLYIWGWNQGDPMIGEANKFAPHFLLGLHPIVWGMAASLVAGVLVSLATSPPPAELVARMFDVEPAPTTASSGAQTLAAS